MKTVYYKMRDIINEKFGTLTMASIELPKIIYLDPIVRDDILEKYPNIKPLITDDIQEETVVFIVSNVPSPYVDVDGKMFLGELDFSNLMPFLQEFFSSKQKGIPINEAFNILIARLTGE